MTGAEWLLVIGGVLVGFGLGDSWHYFRHHRPTRPVHKSWDEIAHVRVIK